VDIIPLPGGEQEKSISSLVGRRVQHCETGIGFGGFEWGVWGGEGVEFFLKVNIAKLLFLRSNVCLTFSLELNWSQDKSMGKFSLAFCVWMM